MAWQPRTEVKVHCVHPHSSLTWTHLLLQAPIFGQVWSLLYVVSCTTCGRSMLKGPQLLVICLTKKAALLVLQVLMQIACHLSITHQHGCAHACWLSAPAIAFSAQADTDATPLLRSLVAWAEQCLTHVVACCR